MVLPLQSCKMTLWLTQVTTDKDELKTQRSYLERAIRFGNDLYIIAFPLICTALPLKASALRSKGIATNEYFLENFPHVELSAYLGLFPSHPENSYFQTSSFHLHFGFGPEESVWKTKTSNKFCSKEGNFFFFFFFLRMGTLDAMLKTEACKSPLEVKYRRDWILY